MSAVDTKQAGAMNNTLGATLIAGGVGIALFARAHRPIEGFMDALGRGPTAWAFKPEFYTGILLFAALCGLAGILRIVRGNRVPNIAKMLSKEESGLERIKAAKELLNAGAIDAAEFDRIKMRALEN